MRVERGELMGVTVEDLVDHYVGSRAKSTLSAYAGAYKKVLEHMLVSGRSLFRWGEGEVMGLMFQLGKEGAGENKLNKFWLLWPLCLSAWARSARLGQPLCCR